MTIFSISLLLTRSLLYNIYLKFPLTLYYIFRKSIIYNRFFISNNVNLSEKKIDQIKIKMRHLVNSIIT